MSLNASSKNKFSQKKLSCLSKPPEKHTKTLFPSKIYSKAFVREMPQVSKRFALTNMCNARKS
jgi:hypothetical protein